MSTTSKFKSSRTKTADKAIDKAIDRPFAPEILKRAKAAVEDYQIRIWFEAGEWYGEGVEFPGAMGDGKTPDACVKAVRESMVALAAYTLEQGKPLPAPAQEGLRTEQVNVRLSAIEKLSLEARARQHGHKGIGDFMRSVALSA